MSYQALNLNLWVTPTPSEGNAVLHVMESGIQPRSAAVSSDRAQHRVVQLNPPESGFREPYSWQDSRWFDRNSEIWSLLSDSPGVLSQLNSVPLSNTCVSGYQAPTICKETGRNVPILSQLYR